MKYKLHTHFKKLLADTFTPVGIYLRLRDRYPGALLLESSDHHGSENSFSFICCNPLATFKLADRLISYSIPGATPVAIKADRENVPSELKNFAASFDVTGQQLKFLPSGLFGYSTYDSVKYFEDVSIHAGTRPEKAIPDMIYSVYKYVIAIDHFKDELYLLEYCSESEPSTLEELETMISNRSVARFGFSLQGDERSNLSDEGYKAMVQRGKEECKRGNLFQIVLSREFERGFRGDEFNVYRALRSINPSPYLFYFDYGDFRIFGSSPEAQLVVKNNVAQIHPIAGTFRRTGDDEADALLSEKLRHDKKENSEHVMLVDLARNDLARNCSEVKVEVFAETQYYSHVIHLVSKVTGKLQKGSDSIRVFADTFPAGTLSGAPKVKAMQVIDACEKDARGYYGGAIGYIGFNGDFNHAIIIRSFLSRNNTLFCRAGAGVVISSSEESELQEVNNKLGALKQALSEAERI